MDNFFITGFDPQDVIFASLTTAKRGGGGEIQALSRRVSFSSSAAGLLFQEYEEPVYSYSTYPDRRFSSRYHNILKMSPPFASSEGVSASGDRYQSDGV